MYCSNVELCRSQYRVSVFMYMSLCVCVFSRTFWYAIYTYSNSCIVLVGFHLLIDMLLCMCLTSGAMSIYLDQRITIIVRHCIIGV